MTESQTLFDAMSEKRYPSIRSHIDDFVATASKRTGALIGLSTGFSELDKRIDGLQGGKTMLVAGRSHHGKTMFFICLELGLISSNPGIIVKPKVFTIDDSISEVINRYLANEMGWSINDVNFPNRVKMNKPEQYTKFCSDYVAATERLKDKVQDIDITDSSHITDYSKLVEEIQLSHMELKEGEKMVVFVDNFHNIRNDCFPEKTKHKDMSDGLKKLAVKLDIPIVMTVMFRKTGEYGRPTIDEIKDAVDMQYDANVIALLHNEYVAKGGDTDVVYRTGATGETRNQVVEVHLCKNKQGSSHGFIYYALFGWKAQMKELDPSTYQGYTQLINGSKKK